MCVACVGAASPEIAVAVGGYAAIRLGRPLQRLRGRRAGREIDQTDDQPDDFAEPRGSAVRTSPSAAPGAWPTLV